MQVFLTIVALLIVLGIVVFVHELGHFLAARWAGVRVDTFSIGFGPALLKWHDKRGTAWKLGCLPLGGYVSIYGQEDMFNRKKYAELPDEKKRGHYLSAPAWKQFIIIAAGVTMNFILAWFIYSAMFMFQPKNVQLPVVGQVIQESVAFNAGVKSGDIIIRIDDEKITNWGELIIAKELASNRDADVLIARGDKLVQVTLSPAERWGLVADGSKTELRKKGFWGAIYSGARETYYQSRTLLVVLKQIVTGERSSKQLGSFITIAEVSGKAMAAGFFAFLSIIALLSVNLAIINLLPLPVLDGGYLLILIIEAITRRKLQGRGMEIAIMIGWLLILGLFILTMWNDLARVFGLNG
ncbi:MAG: site-2 protease family protein [Alphaproteobacteria bacterium]|nr:site-2 protease family protein [Alphaproteobacteria bacterium]